MTLTLRDLLKIPHMEFRHARALRVKTFSGVSTDSRTTKAGDIFIALRGGTFDGHAFIGTAFSRGAAAALAEESFNATAHEGQPLMFVEDTTRALGALARVYRDKFSVPVLAVGGSNGKTTTKDMIAMVLAEKYSVLSTEGNLNNHVGVPQTLFRLTKKHEVAVVEIGTNHPGEVPYLCSVLGPTHALLTNIGREHLEFFGSLEGVAGEEGALFRAFGGAGTAIVNADDPRVVAQAAGVRKTVTFGFVPRRARVRGRKMVLDEAGCAGFEFKTPAMKAWRRVQLAVPGAHNAMNALAAAAAGTAFRVPPGSIAAALASFRASSRRMETLSVGGVVVLNDTYNANPDSMIAALRTLAAMKGKGKKIAVLADMRELGQRSPEEHAAVGREASALGLDFILTYGPLARHIHHAAARAGAIHYEEKSTLAEYLAELAAPGDTVLVKGSRAMAMEDVVLFLQQRRRWPEKS